MTGVQTCALPICVPGHPEVELALMKMYRTTGNKKWLLLAEHFINKRGEDPHFYEKEAAIMEMTISQGNPGQVPSLVERIRDSGVFRSVSHSNWEQEEDNGTVRIHTSVRAVLKEGEQDENK